MATCLLCEIHGGQAALPPMSNRNHRPERAPSQIGSFLGIILTNLGADVPLRGPCTMKAAFFETTGPPDVIQYGELPRPTPKQGEVLVRVGAVCVNPIDTY